LPSRQYELLYVQSNELGVGSQDIQRDFLPPPSHAPWAARTPSFRWETQHPCPHFLRPAPEDLFFLTKWIVLRSLSWPRFSNLLKTPKVFFGIMASFSVRPACMEWTVPPFVPQREDSPFRRHSVSPPIENPARTGVPALFERRGGRMLFSPPRLTFRRRQGRASRLNAARWIEDLLSPRGYFFFSSPRRNLPWTLHPPPGDALEDLVGRMRFLGGAF